MADSQFQTFDLGRVIQTAEAIKGMRQQSITDRLQQQYLGKQIERVDADMARQKRQDQIVLGKEKAETLAIKTAQILRETNPKAYVEQHERDLITNLTANGVDWASVEDGRLKQMVTAMQNHAYQELGVAPLTEQKVGGFSTLQQGGTVIASAAPQTTKLPGSYEEFELSEKDPRYAAFLEKNRGKGIRINPDGTIEIGGTASGVGPGELSKPTVNNLQETIVNNTNRLDRLNQMMTTYNPEYLRARGLLKAGSAELKDFLGMDLSDEQRKYLGGYSEFRSNASQEFSATLKELSGTAASEGEVARVIKGVPSDQDKSPEVFEAKARATTKFITRAIMRANWALKNGIGVNSVDELSKRMPLEGIDGVFESRANQIWQELSGTPETRDQAIQKAQEEFGLAR